MSDASAGAKLRVLDARYGRFRPAGAPHAYTALRIKVRPPSRQFVVSIRYQQLDPPGGAAIADSFCGFGKQAGRTQTFTIPIKLRAGYYRFRVTAESSPCGKPGTPQTTSRTLSVLAR